MEYNIRNFIIIYNFLYIIINYRRRGCPADVEGAKCYMLQLLQMLQNLPKTINDVVKAASK